VLLGELAGGGAMKMKNERCASPGCRLAATSCWRYCWRHQPLRPETTRRVWRAITQARMPGTDYAQIGLRALARRCHLALSTVCRAMLQLERLGYVERADRTLLRIHVGFGEVHTR
jgi:hypothetical protein